MIYWDSSDIHTRTDIFSKDLAAALVGYGMALDADSRTEEAFESTKEGVDLYRNLAQNSPNVYSLGFALSLLELGNLAVRLSRCDAALSAFSEVLPIWYNFWLEHGEVCIENLFNALQGKSQVLAQLGKLDEMPDNEIILYIILQGDAYAGLSAWLNRYLWAVYLDHFWASILEEYNGF